MPLYHYVITRADLSAGEQAAHICHAAAQSSFGLHDGTTHAVVLTVPDEAALFILWWQLQNAGISGVLIADTQGTQTDGTAIGLKPVADRKPIRKLTSHLPLLRSVSERPSKPLKACEHESVDQIAGGTPCTSSVTLNTLATENGGENPSSCSTSSTRDLV